VRCRIRCSRLGRERRGVGGCGAGSGGLGRWRTSGRPGREVVSCQVWGCVIGRTKCPKGTLVAIFSAVSITLNGERVLVSRSGSRYGSSECLLMWPRESTGNAQNHHSDDFQPCVPFSHHGNQLIKVPITTTNHQTGEEEIKPPT
jgi:hypothetical protein